MPNILQRKDNQTYTQNAVEKLFPDLLPKNQNWTYLWFSSLKFCTICFYCIPSWGLSKYIETSSRPLAFTSYKAFLKVKKKSGTRLSASFPAWFFEESYFPCHIPLTDQISLSGCKKEKKLSKLDSHLRPPPPNCVICFTESPLKITKNAF